MGKCIDTEIELKNEEEREVGELRNFSLLFCREPAEAEGLHHPQEGQGAGDFVDRTEAARAEGEGRSGREARCHW